MKKKELLKLKVKELQEMYPEVPYKVGTKKEAYIDEILKPKGLGDTIEKITEVTGIKKLIKGDCGCEERKKKLNKLFPYSKPQCMTKEQVLMWKEAAAEIKKDNVITPKNQDTIIYLLREVLNISVSKENCRTCGGEIWKKYIDMINKVAAA